MEAGILAIQKASGGVLNVTSTDGVTNTDLVLPLSGTVASTDGATVDNTVPRYDGVSGKLQGSGVTVDDSGSLNFTTPGSRIKGDFSNSTLGNRVLIQTSTANSNTALSAIPNGTATSAYITSHNSSDTVNYGAISLRAGSTSVGISSVSAGTVSALPMTFYVGGSERVAIDTAGKVGIGTTSPYSNLDIKSNNTGIEFGVDSAGVNGGYIQYINRTTASSRPDFNYYLSSGGGSHKFFTADIERMRIDSKGNAGFNIVPKTTWYSPMKVLQVGNATSLLNNDGSAGTTLLNGAYHNGTTWVYLNTGRTAQLIDLYNGDYTYYNAPVGNADTNVSWTQRFKIASEGTVTIDRGAQIKANFTSGSAIWSDNVQSASTSWNHFYGTSNNNSIANILIYGNGNIVNANNSYGALSDIKLKENIIDVTPKLDKLMKVRVVNYNLIGQDQKQIGVIAQEIEQIFPSVIDETKDTKQVEIEKERVIPAVEEVIDDEGNVITEAKPESVETYTETELVETGKTTKSVKYSVIYIMMLKGMQEQQEIINDLKARLEVLEAKQ